MARTITNVHERRLAAPAAEVGLLLDRLASPDDVLWPSPTWVPMRFDRPLAVGARGGHGSIRYSVTRYEPARCVEFTFDPSTGLLGTHTLEVEPVDEQSSVLRHRLVGRPVGAARLLWPAIIRSCHDTVLEHLLDNAQRQVSGQVPTPVRYPWRARLAVAMETVHVRAVPVPSSATLLAGSVRAPDLRDAFALRVPDGTSIDPQDWADRVFRDLPRPVMVLLRVRNALVGLVGIDPGDTSAFDTLERTDREVLLGTDERHLDFRASVLVEPGRDCTTVVTVSTVAAVRSRAGRLYLGVVRFVHPYVVRSMLRRAGRTMVAPPTGDVDPALVATAVPR